MRPKAFGEGCTEWPPGHTARGVHCTRRRRFLKPRDRQTDWQTPVRIVSSRDGHETLKPETETETRRLYVTRRYRDVRIGLHVIMIADVNLFSRPLIIIITTIITVLMQRFNAVLLRDTLPAADCTDWVIVSTLSALGLIFKPLREHTYQR